MGKMWLTEEEGPSDSYRNMTKNQRDVQTQVVISIVFGLLAFLSFCVSIDTFALRVSS